VQYTLAYLLAERLALEHVSASDLVEGMIASDTVIGQEMQRFLDRGDSIPDELIEPIILARLRERDCRDKGWVMDGWPRTAAQAQRLVDEQLTPQIAVVLKVQDSTIEDRVSFRIENPATGRLWHHKADPPPLGEQRKCIIRPGETTDEILQRLQIYHERLGPVLERLAQCGADWRVIDMDVESMPMEEYQTLSETMARQIGV
jgi:adenylate kinase